MNSQFFVPIIIFTALMVIFLGCAATVFRGERCTNCSDPVPSDTHLTLHTSACGSLYWTCPTSSEGTQHQLQVCSNGHSYYSCSSQSVKDYHTKAQTCSNGHIYYNCSSEDTKNYHTRQEAGSCLDGHTYYRCKRK